MNRLAMAGLLSLVIPLPAAGAQTNRGTSATRMDEFSSVRCGENVVKALLGRAVRNGPVVEIEAAHREIGLKDTGGSDVNDALFLIGWAMCGEEYQLLETRGRISDAVRFPPHSRRQPAFFGMCTVNGKAVAERMLAVLDNPSPRGPTEPPYASQDTTLLRAITAWRIDEVRARLVPLAVDGLRCPRGGGIFTVDGGM
jgi:hypothetical protein